ncbi:MAG: glycoside hydrolase family 43 protein [Clostridiales bacterium]|nr:glycoside hydrolase family 43 protein [Clostridiales bacterium]
MKRQDINIRDPYIMPYEGRYYLYGTRSETTWGPAEGFDCYVSENLEDWEGPFEIFHRPHDFFADRAFWAPECVYYRDAFYLITTFGEESGRKGIFILKSVQPDGPFELYSERLTPAEWVCIDGTLYFEEDGTPVLFFSHSFEDSPTGDMCFVRLNEDLRTAAESPEKIFEASEAPWALPVPFAKAEFDIDGDVYFTDGPSLIKMDDGKLYMTWSSWSRQAYAVGVAVSENGSVAGPWVQRTEPLYPANGGHGMLFRNLRGQRCFVLHFPNDKYQERPQIYPVRVENGTLTLQDNLCY